MQTWEKSSTVSRMRRGLVGSAVALLLAAVACGTSVPTHEPPSSVGSPTQRPTSTPSVAPEAGFAVPEVSKEPEQTPDIQATVQAMVAATLEAQPTQTSRPASTPDLIVTQVPGTPNPVPQDIAPTAEIQQVQIPTDQPETEESTATEVSPVAPPAEDATTNRDGEGQTAAGQTTEGPETPPTPALPSPVPTATAEPQPTATNVPEPTERPEPTEPPRLGSRSNPIPLGDAGQVQNFRTTWELSVVDITPDAWPIIREENRFNEPPDPGKQFYLLRLRVKNVGEQRAFFVAYVKTTGEAAGLGYTTSGDTCGVYPGSNSREVFPGGQFELNVCWHVATADIPTLLMYWDERPTPGTVWFDLR